MARFISRYTNHRLKAPGGVIEFNQNECVVHDEAKCEYLRKHPDFGVAIFEDKKRDEPSTYKCPNCGRDFKSPQGYASHIKSCKEVPTGTEGDEDDDNTEGEQ